MGYSTVSHHLRVMNGIMVYVKGWVFEVGNHPAKVFALGNKKDVPKPAKQKKSVCEKRFRENLKARYGTNIACKMLRSRNNGGPDRIIVDGVTIYERYKKA